MTLTERKWVEDKIAKLLADLTRGEQALIYKTLYATGLRISDCDDIIAKAFAPEDYSRLHGQSAQPPLSPFLRQVWHTPRKP